MSGKRSAAVAAETSGPFTARPIKTTTLVFGSDFARVVSLREQKRDGWHTCTHARARTLAHPKSPLHRDVRAADVAAHRGRRASRGGGPGWARGWEKGEDDQETDRPRRPWAWDAAPQPRGVHGDR